MLAETRLLTLAGPGGSGKTRLALELAPRLLPEFPDGVWLVELGLLSRPELVSQHVTAALGYREAQQEPLEVLAAQLGGRRLLLLLDNCEHLVTPTAELAGRLLRACPDLYVLATSREPLGVPGEIVLRVPALAASEAEALFADRARAVEPRFKLSGANATAVAQICERLEGIPLAVELAAALARVLPPQQILARLDQRLDLRTLRATIDWSYALLSPEQQALFRRLAVFQGGFGLDAAEVVCGQGLGVLDALAGLVDKSMVLAAQPDGPRSRYRMLDAIAEYARERLLDSGEKPALEARHQAFYESLVLGDDRADHQAWLERMAEDQANVRAAIQRSLDEAPEQALRLAAALGEFWLQHGYLREARRWLDAALQAAPDAPGRDRAAALVAVADIEFYQGDYQAAGAHYREAVAKARAGDYEAELGLALVGLGQLVHADGDSAEARQLLQEGLALERRLGNPYGVTRALGYLGLVAGQEGSLEEAVKISEEALAISRTLGDPTGVYRALRNLAVAAFLSADLERAEAICTEGLRFSQDQGNQVGIPMWLEGFAALASAAHHNQRAVRLAGAARAQRLRMQSAASRPWTAAIQAILEPSRQALGPRRAQEADEAGAALSLPAAIAEALGATASPSPAQNLTARELEIARLVAEGRSNKEIAAGLFITIRTAETHVQNIMNKLGLSSRAQVATWVVERGLRSTTSTAPT
ncbi:MAG TPA: LuxR C-terminal-related transcriptional regulator [Candidatus Dormibacteraeota bacterium]